MPTPLAENENAVCSETESKPAFRERGRANHYERAFAAYVRDLRVPCAAIDQTSRAAEGQARGLKNPDFLLYPPGGPNLIAEVKGKRGKDPRGYRRWENWVTSDDIEGLIRWQTMYGPGFRAVLAFVYEEVPAAGFALPDGDGAYRHQGRYYRFWAVGLDDYLNHLRLRGPAWKAVAMARDAFRKRVRPLIDWLPASLPFDPIRLASASVSRAAKRPKRKRSVADSSQPPTTPKSNELISCSS